MDHVSRSKYALLAAGAAVLLSCGLVAAKAWAWMLGGSAALLASLVDSLIDACISLTNFLAIRYAHRPADHDHRFGHGKAEGIAALAQAAFIGGSCAFVLLEAVRRLSNPQPVASVDFAIGVLLVAIVATLALVQFQKHAVRVSHSLAVEADAAHYSSDIVISLGVIASLLAAQAKGWTWLDPLVAVLIAAWLLYSARGIAAKATDMLLDREIEDHIRLPVMKAIRETPGVEGLHDFRTRRSGARVMISFDIEVDPHLTLMAAHDISRAVEAAVLDRCPHAEVMIHIDPRGDVTDSRHKKLKDFHVE